MTAIAFIGAKGAPGVTTAACASAAVWPETQPVVLLECDPAGGDLAARFGLGTERGMASLVLASRAEAGRASSGSASLEAHVQQLPGGLRVVAGPVGTDAASVVDRQLANLAELPWLRATGQAQGDDLVVDCGRLVPDAAGQRRVLEAVDLVVIVIRGDSSSIVNGRWAADRLAEIRGDRSDLRLALVEPTAFEAGEIADVVGIPLVARFPHDRPAADVLCGSSGSSRVLTRSPLIATARQVVADCVALSSVKGLRHAS